MAMGSDHQNDKDALAYHSAHPPGKVEVSSSKPCNTDKALSLAYSPGVAAPEASSTTMLLSCSISASIRLTLAVFML